MYVCVRENFCIVADQAITMNQKKQLVYLVISMVRRREAERKKDRIHNLKPDIDTAIYQRKIQLDTPNN